MSRAAKRNDTLAENIAILEAHGWVCERSDRRLYPVGVDGKPLNCVWCEGLLFGVARSCYLSTCGIVMLIGESRDCSIWEFVELLELEEDPELIFVGEVADSPGDASPLRKGERSLFE